MITSIIIRQSNISMLGSQDILIIRNKEPVERLTAVKDNTTDDIEARLAAAKALFGILPPDIDLDKSREECLSQVGRDWTDSE